jgi:hypothetical protein
MFISSRTLDSLVQESSDRLAALDKAHELVVAELRNQIANLTSERDWYRKEWTRLRGKAFTKPSEVEQTMPLFDQQPPALDAEWTADDRDLFREWAVALPNGVNAEDEWRRLYGSQSPLIVLTV